MKCTSCGYDNHIDNRFCVKCGNCLTQEASDTPPTSPQPSSSSPSPSSPLPPSPPPLPPLPPQLPSPRKPLSAGKIIGIALAILIGIAGLVAIIILATHPVTDIKDDPDISGISGRPAHSTMTDPEDDFEIPAMSDEPTKIEKFHYEYRKDVAVIKQAQTYSVDKVDDRLVITVHNPNDEIKRLAVGETFAFEPSEQSPGGLAGHIVSVAHDDAKTVITADIPGALDEVFDEFEFAGDINLLADAVEIIPDGELEGAQGVEFARNPTRLFEARFADANIGGVTLNGKITMYTPRVNVSLGIDDVNHLVVTMAAEVNVKASSQLNVDKLINLFTIPVSFYDVNIDVPVGLRVKVTGEGSLEFDCRVDSQFGIRNGNASGQASVKHTFDYNYSARVELTVNVQAKVSVSLIPIYGIQGDFGMGARTDKEMQGRCPDSSCVVIGLFHVRRISSLSWGVLGWIRVLQFSESLVSDEITNYRYLSNGNWRNNCPHDGSDPEETDPAETPPPPPGSLSHLGEPVTLEEAKRTPGLYIKDGEGFILIKPQWEYVFTDYGYAPRSGIVTAAQGIRHNSASVFYPILFNADYEIPKIPNNAKFVIIGITDIAIYEAFDSGWTIPYGLALWDDTVPNYGGWYSLPVNKLLDYTSGSISKIDQEFETINGDAPTNYVSRMLYTGYLYNLTSTHGILRANENEQFTFSWMNGTDRIERTHVADKKFYLLPIDDSVAIQGNYTVRETQEGYFEVNFMTPPEGIYGTGNLRGVVWGGFDNIVEFVTP